MGLLVSARNPGDGARWQDGLAWTSEYCPSARGFDQCADGDGFEDPPVGSGGNGIVYHRPVAFRVEDECSTRSRSYGMDQTRVRRQARAATSFMIARELELGALTQATPYETPDSAGVADVVNAYLAMPSGVVVSEDPWPLAAGVGMLEEAARDALLGQDVFIHMPLRLVALLSEALEREGNLLRTKTGARVVADAGYSGTGPGDPPAAGLWIYATGPVQVRVADPFLDTVVDHRQNRVVHTADTVFAATFDPCTLHALAVVDPAPTPE
jgi:hypothetical protein